MSCNNQAHSFYAIIPGFKETRSVIKANFASKTFYQHIPYLIQAFSSAAKSFLDVLFTRITFIKSENVEKFLQLALPLSHATKYFHALQLLFCMLMANM